LQPKVKVDIPVPNITHVHTYAKDVPASFGVPRSYVRYVRPSVEEISQTIEYNIDEEDENWLLDHAQFGCRVRNDDCAPDDQSTSEFGQKSEQNNSFSKKQKKISSTPQKPKIDDSIIQINKDNKDQNDTDHADRSHSPFLRKDPLLPLHLFEHMIDLLEKATAFETIITTSQAERIILVKIPQLLQIFGGSTGNTPGPVGKKRIKKPVSVRSVVNAVYNYWVQKRSKLKKPLLRKFWPVTACNDTNPHLVFRPREKEKYKLRKKRQNDLDSYRKMQQLRTDFHKVRVLLDLIRRREQLQKCIINLQNDWFEQRIYDMVDTSGLSRESHRLSHNMIENLLQIPKYFDTNNMERGKKKKRKRGNASSGNMANNLPDNRSSPVLMNGMNAAKGGDADSLSDTMTLPKLEIVSQHNPPTFLHTLSSRESYVTSWDNAVPFVPSYVDSHPTPTFRFRHRPRVGRGGRIIIDRLPRPGNPDIPPINSFCVGAQLPMLSSDSKPPEKILDILPQPLDHQKVRRRIEEICLSTMSDEEEDPNIQPSENQVEDGEEVLVKLSDWLDSDEQKWGKECVAIGPI